MWSVGSIRKILITNGEKIARSFFENRRNAVFAGDTIYVKDQVQGQMPEEWKK